MNKLTYSVHDYLAHPYLISDAATPVFVLGLIPQIFLSYLLFSPNDTRLLRKVLLVPTLAFSLWAAFSFQHEEPIRLGQTLGMRALASWFYLRVCEIGLKADKPRWSGHDGDGRRMGKGKGSVTNGGVNGKEHVNSRPPTRQQNDDPKTHWQQFVLGITYFFAFRLNLGWSDSLANPSLVPPFRPLRRRTLLAHHATRAVLYYVLWDVALGLMEASPNFRTFDRRREGSIWDPIVWLGGKVVLPPLASAVYMTLVHILTLTVGISLDHHIICLFYTLFHPGIPTSAPPIFNNLLGTTSVEHLWSITYHQVLKSSFLNLAGRPVRSVARRLGAPPKVQHAALVLAVFAASALQHGYLFTYLPNYQDRETSRAYIVFFLIQPALIAAERLFTFLTGRRVRGPWGAAWTWVTIVATGMPVVNAYFRPVGAVGHGGGREGEVLMPFGAPGRKALRWILGWE